MRNAEMRFAGYHPVQLFLFSESLQLTFYYFKKSFDSWTQLWTVALQISDQLKTSQGFTIKMIFHMNIDGTLKLDL